MRHSDEKAHRVSGALRQRALPIMDTARAVENGFPEISLELRRQRRPKTARRIKAKFFAFHLAIPKSVLIQTWESEEIRLFI
jgi:hypothetical protein